MITKNCTICKVKKNISFFVKIKENKSGYGSRCKECKNSKDKEWRKNNLDTINARRRKLALRPESKEKKKIESLNDYAKNKNQYLKRSLKSRENVIKLANSYKKAPCHDCGKNFPPENMEFDHVRDEKLANVAQILHKHKSIIIAEIEKCEIVCTVCHRIRTAKKNGSSKDPRIIKFHAIIKEIKSVPCLDCGLTYDPIAMDFDHVPERGKKLKEISNMTHFSRSKLLEEIAKCDIVCAYCHRARTLNRFNKSPNE